jgi:hypothetical protein
MENTSDVKEKFIETAVDGLRRVAQGVIVAPDETPFGVIQATVESYRNLAREFLYEEEVEQWLMQVVTRLEVELGLKDLQQTNEPRDWDAILKTLAREGL